MMFFKRTILACTVALLFPALPSYAEVGAENSNSTQAEKPGLWQRFTRNVAETWNNSPNKDLYVPAITWHNRLTYSQEKIDSYNERPWGGGYGISRYDSDGDWHGLYLMVFKDSFNKWEPIGGYAYEKIWR
ncbi:lipid IV(A) palmitoyltransferase PagP, partial [Serratia proteamaculans]